MSVRFSQAAWMMPKESLNPSATLVLMSLADQMNDEGLCWPSHKYTAERTGLSEKQVQRHVQTLKSLRLISVVKNEKGGRPGQTPVYRATGLRNWVTHANKMGPTQGERTGPTQGANAPRRRTQTGPVNGTLTVIEPSKNQELPVILSGWEDHQMAANVLGLYRGQFDPIESSAQFVTRIQAAHAGATSKR